VFGRANLLLKAPRRASRFVAATLSPFDATLVSRFEAGSRASFPKTNVPNLAPLSAWWGGRSISGGTIATSCNKEL